MIIYSLLNHIIQYSDGNKSPLIHTTNTNFLDEKLCERLLMSYFTSPELTGQSQPWFAPFSHHNIKLNPDKNNYIMPRKKENPPQSAAQLPPHVSQNQEQPRNEGERNREPM